MALVPWHTAFSPVRYAECLMRERKRAQKTPSRSDHYRHLSGFFADISLCTWEECWKAALLPRKSLLVRRSEVFKSLKTNRRSGGLPAHVFWLHTGFSCLIIEILQILREHSPKMSEGTWVWASFSVLELHAHVPSTSRKPKNMHRCVSNCGICSALGAEWKQRYHWSQGWRLPDGMENRPGSDECFLNLRFWILWTLLCRNSRF